MLRCRQLKNGWAYFARVVKHVSQPTAYTNSKPKPGPCASAGTVAGLGTLQPDVESPKKGVKAVEKNATCDSTASSRQLTSVRQNALSRYEVEYMPQHVKRKADAKLKAITDIFEAKKSLFTGQKARV